MNKRRLLRQRAQGLVEFAVIFPVFAFLLFAVIDGGLLMGRYNNINNAAKEGARAGAVQHGDGDAALAAVIDRVTKQAHGELDDTADHPLSTDCDDYDSPPADTNVVCAEWISGADGEAPGEVGASVRVRVKYHYRFLTPIVNWFAGTGWTIEACAVQREERPVDSPPSADAGADSCETGGGGSTPTPPPAATDTPVPTDTPVSTNTPGSGATATNTPVPPTATNTPVPTPTACRHGRPGDDCRATQTAIAGDDDD